MAIGLLATITVLEGKNEEFEQTFLDLTEKVRANEPGNVFYALHKSGSDPQVYKVMEQYDSPEALDAHGKTDYFRDANKQLVGFVAGAPEIEILEGMLGGLLFHLYVNVKSNESLVYRSICGSGQNLPQSGDIMILCF